MSTIHRFKIYDDTADTEGELSLAVYDKPTGGTPLLLPDFELVVGAGEAQYFEMSRDDLVQLVAVLSEAIAELPPEPEPEPGDLFQLTTNPGALFLRTEPCGEWNAVWWHHPKGLVERGSHCHVNFERSETIIPVPEKDQLR